MDKEQQKTMALFGYSVEEMPNMKTIPRLTYYLKDGTPLPNLPADAYHMKRYLQRGFLLKPPSSQNDGGGVNCPHCDFTAKSAFGLMAHMRKHSKKEE